MSTPNQTVSGRALSSDPAGAQSGVKGRRRITKKDLELLTTLVQNGGKMKRSELVESQAYTTTYYLVALRRVYKLQELGLVEFKPLGPRGGIWALLTDKGKRVLAELGVTKND